MWIEVMNILASHILEQLIAAHEHFLLLQEKILYEVNPINWNLEHTLFQTITFSGMKENFLFHPRQWNESETTKIWRQ